MSVNALDITPTPRILRTLGEIPFQTWQCIAELIDNSIDAFLSSVALGDAERRIKFSLGLNYSNSYHYSHPNAF